MASGTNWLKIKNEYINGNISYRKLAEKYKVSLPAIAKRAKQEDWQSLRGGQYNKSCTKVIQKTAEKLADAESDYIVDIAMLNHGLAGVVKGFLTSKDKIAELEPRDLKALTAALKDIKDIQMYAKGALEIKEEDDNLFEAIREAVKADEI